MNRGNPIAEAAAMATGSRWATLVAKKAEVLRDRVERMERGGDLEGLIEEGLEGIIGEIYKELLSARECAASAKADFSPSGVPPVSGTDESGQEAAAPHSDVARGGRVRAKRV